MEHPCGSFSIVPAASSAHAVSFNGPERGEAGVISHAAK
jgi:hypothetical protein